MNDQEIHDIKKTLGFLDSISETLRVKIPLESADIRGMQYMLADATEGLNRTLRDDKAALLDRPTCPGQWWWLADNFRTGQLEWTVVHIEANTVHPEPNLYSMQGMRDFDNEYRKWHGKFSGPIPPPPKP